MISTFCFISHFSYILIHLTTRKEPVCIVPYKYSSFLLNWWKFEIVAEFKKKLIWTKSFQNDFFKVNNIVYCDGNFLWRMLIFFSFYVSFTGFWHDYNCGHEFRSICKRTSSPPPNATVAPTESPKGGCKENWTKLNSKVRLMSCRDINKTNKMHFLKIYL